MCLCCNWRLESHRTGYCLPHHSEKQHSNPRKSSMENVLPADHSPWHTTRDLHCTFDIYAWASSLGTSAKGSCYGWGRRTGDWRAYCTTIQFHQGWTHLNDSSVSRIDLTQREIKGRQICPNALPQVAEHQDVLTVALVHKQVGIVDSDLEVLDQSPMHVFLLQVLIPRYLLSFRICVDPIQDSPNDFRSRTC